MVEIVHTEDILEGDEKIIRWSDVGSGDIGKPASLAGYRMLSIYTRKTTVGNITVGLVGANENVDISDFEVIQTYASNVMSFTNVSNYLIELKPAFLGVTGISGDTGKITVSVLVRRTR